MPEGEDWEEYGGDLMWVAGLTEGGAPYGLTVASAWRTRRPARDAGWVVASSC